MKDFFISSFRILKGVTPDNAYASITELRDLINILKYLYPNEWAEAYYCIKDKSHQIPIKFDVSVSSNQTDLL